MEWIERLNCAVEYMEAHLLEKIDYEKVAEYIRRRMSLAAVDLQDAGASGHHLRQIPFSYILLGFP